MLFRSWRFAPKFGVPYYEDILIKNPNLERIRRIIKNELLSVKGVNSARDIRIEYDKSSRMARIFYTAVTGEETYREELEINV